MAIFLWKEKGKKILCGLLAAIVLWSSSSLWGHDNRQEMLANETLSMYASSYALTDGDTGRVLVGNNETNPMANASTTKILTCIVTLERCNLDEMVTVSENAASQPKVRLGMNTGEQYPLKDMLYGLMLESYNDCAVAIAEHVAGSETEFSKILNEKAKEIGCVDTFFITPNGLDREENGQFHHTTASDLCLIMAYCVWESPMKDVFLQITQTRSYTGSSNGNSYSFTNRNAFLDQMDGVLSGKTGFTAKAGYCYVAALEQDGERYCIALLACGWPNNKTYKWHDARKLFTYGQENYNVKDVHVEKECYKLIVDGFLSPPDFWNMNQGTYVELQSKERNYQLLMMDGETIKQEISLIKDVTLPIEEGDVLGACDVYLGDVFLERIPICSTAKAEEWKWEDILECILCQFLTFSS